MKKFKMSKFENINKGKNMIGTKLKKYEEYIIKGKNNKIFYEILKKYVNIFCIKNTYLKIFILKRLDKVNNCLIRIQ